MRILLTLAIGWGLVAGWHTRPWYAVVYSVGISEVNIDKEPHDCEFLVPPIGDKHCSYERETSIVLRHHVVERDYISFDEGKTWEWDRGQYKGIPLVTVSWKKVED